jgi:protease-4
MRLFSCRVAIIAALCWSAPALAQTSIQYAEEPTDGLNLPATALAGEHDALSTVANPAGLLFLSGGHFGLAVDYSDEDDATSSGPGLGLYSGQTIGGGLVPRFGFGMGLEFLEPSRVALSPDPGSPARFTLATAMSFGRSSALGVSWHRFFDDGITDGLTTWDIGLATRFGGNHWAAGAVVRDVNAPTVGGAPVQRRYELELVSRPGGTERFELGLGGRVGETRGDLDGWLRWSARVTRGVYFRGEVLARELHVIETSPSGVDMYDEHEIRATFGLEISLGGIGATGFGSVAFNEDRDARFGNGTLIVRASEEEIPSVLGDSDRIEKLELSGAVSDRGLTNILLKLRAIARDPAVKGVFLQLDGLAVGWASLQELRAQIGLIRKAGKKVFVYMVAGTGRDYFVACAADRVYVDPAGGLRMAGFAGTVMYFKGLFDKIGVSAEFEKIREYKSAPEAWTRTSPSEPALRMRNELYDSLYDELVMGIANSRGLDADVVRELIDNGPYTAGDLEGDTRLVDAIVTPDELGEAVAQEMGAVYPVAAAARERSDRWELPAIAVIYIDGDIIDGKNQSVPLLGRKMVGSETITQAIAAARASDDVKAIVLRIDSPGGSALASEMMAREIFKTRGVKPIICSMGDIAASGGYYVAAGCDVVFAEPMTITGSIGIFYGKFDFSSLLDRLGVSTRTYKRGEHADMESFFRPYTDEERELIMEKMTYLYERFTGAVAEGRGMTQDEVNEVGRGHVWTGAQAKPINLIDRYGGIVDAITYAKAEVGLGDDDRARVIMLPKIEGNFLGKLLGVPGLSSDEQSTTDEALELLLGKELLEAIPASLWAQPNTAQARLPFSIVWH